MNRRITWRKGMRLSAETLAASDEAMHAVCRQLAVMSVAGRCGLYPSVKPFELTVNVADNEMEIVSISCHGITRDGRLCALEFDSAFSRSIDTRVAIPSGASEWLLVVKIADEWREVDGTYSEPSYHFALVGVNTPLDDASLPIGCLVNNYGWRLDEDFVPPCLYINSHLKYQYQWQRMRDRFLEIASKCAEAQGAFARKLLGFTWRSASRGAIRLARERDTLSPMAMLGILQSFVSDFLISCSLDDYISLENSEPFSNFAGGACQLKDLYSFIETGLSLCAEIAVKVEKIAALAVPDEPEPKPEPAPRPDNPGKRTRIVRRDWEGLEI